jgi:hypothetical protein
MSATESRVEMLWDTLAAEYEKIKVASGYRSNVVLPIADVVLDPSRVTDSPRISVIFGPESIPVLDSSKSIFNSTIGVMVVGYVKAATSSVDSNGVMAGAAEALLHDMKRITADITKYYLTSATNKWQILKTPEMRATRFVIPQQNIGWVTLEYTVQLFAQDADF